MHWECGYHDGLNNRSPAINRYLRDSEKEHLDSYMGGYRMGVRHQPDAERNIEGDLLHKPETFELRK
jgi:hypothetical protein